MPLSPRTLSVRTLTRARLHQRQAARLLLQSLEERVVPANSVFAVGSDAGSTAQVLVYDAATRALLTTLSPFPTSFTGGVRVAVADVTGDGAGDVVVSEGPGGTNQVRVYDGATFKALKGTLGGFAGFTTAEADGVWVAAGDVSGDGKADLVLGTDGAHTPKVKILSGANGSLVRNVDLAGFDA
ncbi:MAG: VCBS repeat-containing protein, partial [Zavarzinella sp.]|nr:VCBS repeat-containing protein [Zavarzinella sp.]